MKNVLKKCWDQKIFRFVCVGIINTCNDLIILNVLVFYVGVNPVLGNFVSASIAIVISYFLNQTLVFQKQNKRSISSFMKFFVVTGLSIVLVQTIVIYAVTHIMNGNQLASSAGITQTQAELVIVNSAKLLAVIFGMIWNYALYHLVVFGKVEDQAAI